MLSKEEKKEAISKFKERKTPLAGKIGERVCCSFDEHSTTDA